MTDPKSSYWPWNSSEKEQIDSEPAGDVEMLSAGPVETSNISIDIPSPYPNSQQHQMDMKKAAGWSKKQLQTSGSSPKALKPDHHSQPKVVVVGFQPFSHTDLYDILPAASGFESVT